MVGGGTISQKETHQVQIGGGTTPILGAWGVEWPMPIGGPGLVQGNSGGPAEGDVGEFELGLLKGLVTPLLLPVVDDLGGFVEDFNPLVIRDPALAFQLGFQGFPGVLAGPEEIGGEWAGSAPHDLIHR